MRSAGEGPYVSYSVKRYDTRGADGGTGQKWRAVFQRKGADGRWHQKSVTLETEGRDRGRSRRVEDAARMEAAMLMGDLNAAEAIADDADAAVAHMTVAELVREFIDSNNQIARSTRTGYDGMLRRIIAPRIGSADVSTLSRAECQRFADGVARDYSRPVAQNAFRLVKSSLRWAADEENGYIGRSPCERVRLPKPDAPVSTVPNAIPPGEVARLLAAINGGLSGAEGCARAPLLLGMKVSLYTGLRRAEVCALRWRDVDLDGGTLDVAQSIGNDHDTWYIKCPKSYSSRRRVELPAEIVGDLRRRREAMRSECAAAGARLTRDMYVIGGADGSWVKPPRLTEAFNRLASALNIHGTQRDDVVFHDLRHTYATTLIQGGVDVATAARLMGHSDPSITLRRYASTSTEAMRAAADRLGDAYAAM